MERKIALLIIACLFGLSPLVASFKSEVYNAYLNKDMAAWKVIMNQLDAYPSKSNADVLELINYQYGYIGWCLSVDCNKEAKRYLLKAEANAQLLTKQGFKRSSVNAYLAAFWGFRISLSPIKAPVLGPKSLDCAEQAMKQDPSNPLGYLQQGNALYYRPKLLGGSKEKALQYYLKAEQLMLKAGIKEEWIYLNLLAQIGQGYQETGQPQKAQVYFEKALKVEPRFNWVKDELLPKLNRFHKE